MEGLETSIVRASTLSAIQRLDPQFFKKRYLLGDHALASHALKPLGRYAFVTDGPHGYHEVDDASPIAMLTAKCATDWFADRVRADTIAKWVDDANRRSALQMNDLILSTRGTVGNCAAVTPEALPANLDQDVARISLNERSPWQPFFVLAYLNCRFGQDHIRRHTSGMVQHGLSLAAVRSIPIPVVNVGFQTAITNTVNAALQTRRAAREKQDETEGILLAALGLLDWEPPESVSYTARAAHILDAQRMDATFFTPRIQALLNVIGRDGRRVKDVAASRRERFRPSDRQWFDYIEIGGIDYHGTAGITRLAGNDAPSRATWYVRAGDIITSTVRPIRRLTAQIASDQAGFVCSSGFVVIIPGGVAPDLLFTYLRLPMICELLDLYSTASMYPAVRESHIFDLPLPRIDAKTEARIVRNMCHARAARAEANQLLNGARRAVEIAVVRGEQAATRFLDRHGSLD